MVTRYKHWCRHGAMLGLVLLFALCLAWEAWLVPLRPGSVMWVKALPLLLPMRGVVRGERYTFQWLSMFVLAWFMEGVVRAWADHGLSRSLALGEIVLSVWVFTCAVAFAHQTRST